jgi:hypothetical protein
VRDARLGIPPPNIGDPFAVNGPVDQRIVPKSILDRRTSVREVADGTYWQLCHLTVGQGLYRMVSDPQHRVLQVYKVTFHVNGDDLSAAGAYIFEPDAKAGEHQPAMRYSVAFSDNRLVPFDGHDGEGQTK